MKREKNPLKRFFKLLGPGLITGASDDDPSGIGTYSQAGAQFGFSMLWMAWVTYPLMATVQYICAKIGLVTGVGLSGVLRKHYPRPVLWVCVALLAIANTINVGADLGAMAASVHLLVPSIPAMAVLFPIAAVFVLVLVFGSYQNIVRIFKWLTLSLFAYVLAAFFTHPNWSMVLHHTFIPDIRFNKDYLAMYVGLLGTTISPYLFFWQTSAEVEEERAAGYKYWQRLGASDDDLKYAAADVNTGMFFSNLVMYFIILTTGATLFTAGQHQIASADQAAMALKPLAGPFAEVLFAIGIIGTGFLAVPVLVGSCAYALSTVFGWRRGLYEKWYRAKQFYGVIVVAFFIGMGLNFFHVNAMAALFWTAVINGVLAPPLLVMIMLISNNRKIMGNRVNSTLVNVLGWITTVAMTVAAVGLIVTSI
ncbi:MAG TPA: divalent metal cation transporter [Candidatus Obscuribacterales bacterium]